MTLPPFKDVPKEALCPKCHQVLTFSLGKTFKKHAYFQCSGPPPEEPKPSLVCPTCTKKFASSEKFSSHLCQRQKPSADSTKYTLQRADGPLRHIILKADEHELYELCFSQVLFGQCLSFVCSCTYVFALFISLR